MTETEAEQMLQKYPNIMHAASFVELMLDIPPEGESESSLDLMRRANVSLDDAINMARGCIQQEVDLGSPGKYKEAFTETFHESFRTYMAAKMGMM
jgi:hypothetical protein